MSEILTKVEVMFNQVQVLLRQPTVSQGELLVITSNSSQKEVGVLIAKLTELKVTTEKTADDETIKVCTSAEHDRLLAPRSFSANMEGYYNNEVSSIHVETRQVISRINDVIKDLTEICRTICPKCLRQMRTERETAPTFSCVFDDDGGAYEKVSHICDGCGFNEEVNP